jgi:hypothetical protein
MRAAKVIGLGSLAAMIAAAAPAWAEAGAGPWVNIVAGVEQATYAIGMAPSVPVNAFGFPAQYAGTAFQAYAGGEIRQYTAGHCVLYYVPDEVRQILPGWKEHITAHWSVWGQISTRALGASTWDYQVGFFAPTNTLAYPTEDVAETTSFPMLPGSTVAASSGAPLVDHALTIGNWHALRRGETVVDVGDAQGSWYAGGTPTVTYLRYRGTMRDLIVSGDMPSIPPEYTVPEVEVFSGQTQPGTSGSPIIDAQGQVVGILIAGNGEWTYAVPLWPNGIPADSWWGAGSQVQLRGWGD